MPSPKKAHPNEGSDPPYGDADVPGGLGDLIDDAPDEDYADVDAEGGPSPSLLGTGDVGCPHPGALF
jgi:hypothetical protein